MVPPIPILACRNPRPDTATLHLELAHAVPHTKPDLGEGLIRHDLVSR